MGWVAVKKKTNQVTISYNSLTPYYSGPEIGLRILQYYQFHDSTLQSTAFAWNFST